VVSISSKWSAATC